MSLKNNLKTRMSQRKLKLKRRIQDQDIDIKSLISGVI
jgi:hypothetical protein